MSRRLRLTVGYLGTRYAGWASQAPAKTGGLPTIQDTLEGALASVLGHPVRVTAAGRTDAGVHAAGQVVSFDTTASLPAAAVVRLLPRYLPADDIWPIASEECADVSFSARHSALRRWYRYLVWQGSTPPAEVRGRCEVIPDPLDVRAMRQASHQVLGRQDFASFAARPGRVVPSGYSTVRTIWVADWLQATDAPLLTFEVCADAFLRHMVRNLVGSLLWVGQGRWSPDDFATALAAKDRTAAGPAAPARGLTLWKIDYEM